MRILVTGSREFGAYFMMIRALYKAHKELSSDRVLKPTIIHGGARGADKLAANYATQWGWAEEPYASDWQAPCRNECKPGHRRTRFDGTDYCPAAGNYRNQEMVDAGADVCLAFFKKGAANRGTRDCVRRAEKAGIAVRKFYEE